MGSVACDPAYLSRLRFRLMKYGYWAIDRLAFPDHPHGVASKVISIARIHPFQFFIEADIE
jgi:hypothetical protein